MQNITMDMEKTPGSIELGPEIKYCKHPKGLCTKTLMTAVGIPIIVLICLFLASVYYVKLDQKNKILRYSARCALGNYEEYNKNILYILQTDDWNPDMMISVAPQIAKDLIIDYSYGYLFREDIEYRIEDGTRIHTVAINFTDIIHDFLVSQFIHNFKKNHTAIVDYENKRCFIMRLNHNVTINAYKFLISMQRMEYLYPKLQDIQLKLPKRIILPAITDLLFADKEMVKDCHDKKVYMLTDYRPNADFPVEELTTKEGRFYEFFGRGIFEYSLVNFNEILLHEKKL